jgi:ABC-type lipoprotein release transport system permease subunit
MLLDGVSHEIIGVLPAGFRFLDMKPMLVTPFQFDRNKLQLGNFSYQGVGRLKPGVTMEQASADVGRMIPLSYQRFPPFPGYTTKMFEDAQIVPALQPFKKDLVGDIGNILWVLMGTMGIVLMIACANVANLLLVRAEGRQHELAIRTALGASLRQISRELLMESLTIGITAGAVGLTLAYFALKIFVATSKVSLPRLDEISLNAEALVFTLAISILSGLFFGLIPVLKYAELRLTPSLRAGGRNSSQSREQHRARSLLVVVQVALALVLLISSGLMIRTFQALRDVQPGFTNAEQVQTLSLYIPDAQVKNAEQVFHMQREILDRLRAIPGVSSAAILRSVPMGNNSSNDAVFAEDHTYAEGQLPPIRRFNWISPGMFQTLGNTLLAGRDFNWNEIAGYQPVAIVYWPALMKDFQGDAVSVQRYSSFAIRSSRAGSEGFLKAVREAVWSVDPSLPVADVRTLQYYYDRSLARTSLALMMLAVAGAMALLLGVVGIYGVISYSVTQRTREIGIRLAVGAQQGEVAKMFVRHGVMLLGIGVVAGLVVAFLCSRLMATLLFGVKAVDPMTYAVVAVGLVGCAMVASYVPARRALNVDPVEALRAE